MDVGSNIITRTGSATLGLGQMLLSGIEPSRFARLPEGLSGPVQTNHPAFVYGHLSLYPHRIVEWLEGDAEAAAPPASYGELFSPGATCLDDPDGTIYPSMEEITDVYLRSHQAAIGSLEGVPDDMLARDAPTEGRMRELFPSIGASAAFLLSGHPMMHLGQVSAWRRMMGLGSAM